jgi:hypothetical protein
MYQNESSVLAMLQVERADNMCIGVADNKEQRRLPTHCASKLLSAYEHT